MFLITIECSWNCQSSWNHHAEENGESLFKLGRYNRVFLEISVQITIWAPMLKQWAVGSFFLQKYSRRAHRDPQKFFFFIKTGNWKKWWSWWLRMTNAFILCNLLWKVQKSLAVKREGSFNMLDFYIQYLKCATSKVFPISYQVILTDLCKIW